MEEDWEPKTKLGKMVKSGEITDMTEIFEQGLPVMEAKIVDTLLPDLEEDVIDINLVQRMHSSGRRIKFRATVAVGNGNGYIGLGKGKAKEVGPAIRKAIVDAKLNLIQIRRGCGSWECGCALPHSVPLKVMGAAGSVRVTLIPAPNGIGLAAGDVGKKILKLAGIKDAWSKTKGQTQSTINSAKATFDALRQTSRIKITEAQSKSLGIVSGKVEE